MSECVSCDILFLAATHVLYNTRRWRWIVSHAIHVGTRKIQIRISHPRHETFYLGGKSARREPKQLRKLTPLALNLSIGPTQAQNQELLIGNWKFGGKILSWMEHKHSKRSKNPARTNCISCIRITTKQTPQCKIVAITSTNDSSNIKNLYRHMFSQLANITKSNLKTKS
jgi:hypothetical protein